MDEMKNAVIVGKVDLPPAKQAPKQAPRRTKRADDRSSEVADNQQVMAELQHLKKQLNKARSRFMDFRTLVSDLAANLRSTGTFDDESLAAIEAFEP